MISELNSLELYFIKYKRSANMPTHELAQVFHMYLDRDFEQRSVHVKFKKCILDDLVE